MTDWKPEKNISSPWDVDAMENNIGEPIKYEYIVPSHSSLYIHNPEVICEFDMFGQKQLVISFHRSNSFPVPNRWIRFWTKVFFNSKWDFKK